MGKKIKFNWEFTKNGYRFIPKGKEITVNDILEHFKDKKQFGRYIIPVHAREEDHQCWGGYDDGQLVIDVYEFLDDCPICGKNVFHWWCEKCGNEFHGHIEKDYKFCPMCGERLKDQYIVQGGESHNVL